MILVPIGYVVLNAIITGVLALWARKRHEPFLDADQRVQELGLWLLLAAPCLVGGALAEWHNRHGERPH